MSGLSAAITPSATSSATLPATPSATPSAPVAATSSATPSAPLASVGVNTGMTQDTRQFVIKLFSVAIVVFAGAILAVLLYRAFVDGNAPLTSQITQGLINLLPWLFGFLAAIIVGEPVGTSLVARALPMILGGGVVTMPGATSSAAGSASSASSASSATPPAA